MRSSSKEAAQLVIFLAVAATSTSSGRDGDWAWQSAHASLYASESDTMGGACGYGNLYSSGYGVETAAALSKVLFNHGRSCGACFEIKPTTTTSSSSIRITATDFFYSDDAQHQQHFELSMPVFLRIGMDNNYRPGIVIPVTYRRVACLRSGGVRFTINGFRYFNLVLITNVAGAGDVVRAAVKASHTEWLPMARNWGQNWHCNAILIGGDVSFRVTTSDSRTITAWNVAADGWRFGYTFQAKNNFRLS